MIKIIHVLTDTNIGGAGIWLLNYLRSYDRKKYDISVAIPEKSMLLGKIKDLGVRVFEIPNIADCSYSKEGIAEFLKLFKREAPDIVHTHASLSARIAAKKLKIKIINTRHCLEDRKPFLKRIVYSIINNYLSDIVIGVSKATCDNLIADGTKKEKVRLLYNGAFAPSEKSEEEKKEIKKKFNIPENHVVIGIVARLESGKNHELFLKAIKLLSEKEKNIKALIVGDGTQDKNLKAMACELKIDDKVIFTGYQNDISDTINIIDINTLTSKTEALSLSLIEGMYLEKASVSTASGGPCEVIEDNVTGFIVENNNENALADAIYRLINDKELRCRMGKNAKKRANKIFTMEKMINSLDGIYEELMSK